MADSEREMQTKPLTPTPTPPLAALHLIAYLNWKRETAETFETNRARLLDALLVLQAQMSEQSDGRPLPILTLTGGAIILDDIASARPEMIAPLVVHNAGGRLSISPWYVVTDETLVSGESLIRNLLIGRATAEAHGMKTSPVFQASYAHAHPAQLPQILRAFGVDAAFLRHSAGVGHLPYRWIAPDGSHMLAIHHNLLTDADAIHNDLSTQRNVRPDGPFVWFVDMEHEYITFRARMQQIAGQVSVPVQAGGLREFSMMLRRELPDSVRPSIMGALQRNDASEGGGTIATRLHLKQAHAAAESRLLRAVEPWLAVALTRKDNAVLSRIDNVRALLRRAWRLLLANQTWHALGGAVSDAVSDEIELRYRQLSDLSAHLTESAQVMLAAGQRHRAGVHVSADETFVTVWNPHNWPLQQVVEVALDLPDDRVPTALHPADAAAGAEPSLFGWRPESNTLILLADAPALGYACYRVTLGAGSPEQEAATVKVTAGNIIGKTTGETLSASDGRLTWKQGDLVIDDVLTFHDGGDAGDAYGFRKPSPDVMLQADLIANVQIESTPLYERLIITHRMRVAPSLRPDGGRERGLKLLQLRTTATLYEHTSGVYFHTTFENTAEDHRLRAHIRTAIDAETATTDAPFYVDTSAVGDGLRTAQTFVSVREGGRTLTVLQRGLPQYELLRDESGVNVALTLLRSVGQLARNGNTARVAIDGAQCKREISAAYALVNGEDDDRAGLLRRAMAYASPLQAYQFDSPPEDRPRRSFLSVVSDFATGADSDGDGVILTALKPAERGGWIVRLYNPHDTPVEIYLTPYIRPSKAYLVTLSEALETIIETDANGRVAMIVNPQEVVTVLLSFD